MLLGRASFLGISLAGTDIAAQMQSLTFMMDAFIGVLLVITIIYIMTTMYHFPLMVTYEISVWAILKNSFILITVKFLKTVLEFLAVSALVILLMLLAAGWNYGLLLAEVALVFFGFAFIDYTNNTFADIKFNKYLDSDDPVEDEPTVIDKIKAAREEELNVEDIVASDEDEWNF